MAPAAGHARYLFALVFVGGVLAACSGAATQDVLESNAKSGSSSGTSGTVTSGGTSGGTSGTATSGGTSGGTSGNTSGGTSGTVGDASIGCPQEMEPNDNRGTANTLAPTRCGTISPKGESDFLTFVLADKTTSMQLTFTGQVTLKVDVNGQSVTLGDGQSPKVPFVKGKTYFVEVQAIQDAPSTPWRVDLIEM